mmetsp:Transcript_65108/g.115693  ORF Transcript_65108/g.115693 Transcript_65108/m.115693 type:complete len:258 (-) Transcript_65108:4-777(-)
MFSSMLRSISAANSAASSAIRPVVTSGLKYSICDWDSDKSGVSISPSHRGSALTGVAVLAELLVVPHTTFSGVLWHFLQEPLAVGDKGQLQLHAFLRTSGDRGPLPKMLGNVSSMEKNSWIRAVTSSKSASTVSVVSSDCTVRISRSRSSALSLSAEWNDALVSWRGAWLVAVWKDSACKAPLGVLPLRTCAGIPSSRDVTKAWGLSFGCEGATASDGGKGMHRHATSLGELHLAPGRGRQWPSLAPAAPCNEGASE